MNRLLVEAGWLLLIAALIAGVVWMALGHTR